MNKTLLKVSSTTSTKQLAGCIANCVEEGKETEIRAIGASAVNQMYKSLAIASSIVASKGFSLLFKAGFADFEENGDVKTAMIARIVVR